MKILIYNFYPIFSPGQTLFSLLFGGGGVSMSSVSRIVNGTSFEARDVLDSSPARFIALVFST